MSDLLRVIGGLAWREMLLGWRSAGFRAAAVICAVAAGTACAEHGTTASLAGYLVSRQACVLVGLAALVWMSNTACRDAWMSAEELTLSKPQSSEVLLLARFAGNFALVLLLAVAALAGGAVMQVSWGGTPFVPMAYLDAFVRSFTPLLTLSALGFSLCALFGTPVAGGVVALYWVLVLSGRDYVSRIFNFSLTQNSPVYLLLSAGVLALTLLTYRPHRRGELRRWPRPLVAATAGLLALAVGLAITFTRSRYDPPLHMLEGMEAIRSQHLQPDGRLPGFWLPGTAGPRVGLHAFEGRILVVGLWSPAVPESLPMLEFLRHVQQQLGARGVTPIAICISDDTAVAGHFARENRYPFPMLLDPGARITEAASAGSPVAEAYDANVLPKLVIADRERQITYVATNVNEEDPQLLKSVQDLVMLQP